MNNIWSSEVDVILSVGVSLECIGIKNWALSRNEAISAICELETHGVPILGGDVYHLVNGVAEQTYDNWYCDRDANELASEFLRRSVSKAKSYIENYKVDGALFAIVPMI